MLPESCKILSVLLDRTVIHSNSDSAHLCPFGLQWFGVSDHDGATPTGHPRPQATQLDDGLEWLGKLGKILEETVMYGIE